MPITDELSNVEFADAYGVSFLISAPQKWFSFLSYRNIGCRGGGEVVVDRLRKPVPLQLHYMTRFSLQRFLFRLLISSEFRYKIGCGGQHQQVMNRLCMYARIFVFYRVLIVLMHQPATHQQQAHTNQPAVCDSNTITLQKSN